MESLLQAFSDLNEMYRTLTLRDVALPTFLLIWVAVLAFPLRGIPRDDFVTGATYMMYGCATGIFLIIVLPNKLFGQTLSSFEHSLLFLTMILITGLRWWLRSNALIKKVKPIATANSAEGS